MAHARQRGDITSNRTRQDKRKLSKSLELHSMGKMGEEPTRKILTCRTKDGCQNDALVTLGKTFINSSLKVDRKITVTRNWKTVHY